MGTLGRSLPMCPREKRCWSWARVYMKYCLCNLRDGFSLGLGLMSVVSWGVAEVPQIITNYTTKTTEGISIAFLLTWVLGDFFNVFGCMLETATLPTQFYMAILYTVTTVVLTGQTIYYSHIYHRLKGNRKFSSPKGPKLRLEEAPVKENLIGSVGDGRKAMVIDKQGVGSVVTEKGFHPPSSPIPVAPMIPPHNPSGRGLYYMSARSLAKSHTPTTGSYLATLQGSARTPPTSVPNQGSAEEPLLCSLTSARSEPPLKTKSVLCAVSIITFFLGSIELHNSANNRNIAFLTKPPKGVVIQIGRRILQKNGERGTELREGGGSNAIGTILGWAMAAIYMGGRLPQIFLNIKRGTVEGLNPLMFVFALIGNLTYVFSILVRSMEWSKISPNLPWLVDAGACVVLDSFILVQFIYFRYRNRKSFEDNNDHYISA